MRKALVVIVVAAAALATGGCTDTWEGFVYPNRSNLRNSHSVGTFRSLDDCRAAARALLANLNALDRGDYECGRNCDNGSRHGVKVCKETVR
jgi:hypothetical protein